jgi:cell division protein FtsQ
VRRFTKQSRRRRLTAAIALGTLVTLVGGAAALSVSPLLSLASIRVVGAERLDADAVAGALDDRLGTPLALVTDDQIRADLEQFALIRSFSTEIVPPDTLIVRLVERTPIGALPTASGVEVVDAAGVVVETAEEPPPGIPILRVGAASADDPAFRGVADVLLALPRELRASVATISATTRDDVRFTLGGAEHSVVWGSAERSAFKARVLAAALATTDQSVSWVYDVSAPDSLVVRRAG